MVAMRSVLTSFAAFIRGFSINRFINGTNIDAEQNSAAAPMYRAAYSLIVS